jgi:hypothetical protein
VAAGPRFSFEHTVAVPTVCFCGLDNVLWHVHNQTQGGHSHMISS